MGKHKKHFENKKYVINPSSGRPVLIGGQTWRGLVSPDVLPATTAGKNVAYMQRMEDFKNDEEAIKNLDKQKKVILRQIRDGKHDVPRSTSLARRGLTTLVYCKKRLDGPDITNRAVEAAMGLVEDIRSGALYIDPSLTIYERQDFIRTNVAEKMLSPPSVAHIPRVLSSKPKKNRIVNYLTYSVFDESESEYE